jgi:hypothetical protein
MSCLSSQGVYVVTLVIFILITTVFSLRKYYVASFKAFAREEFQAQSFFSFFDYFWTVRVIRKCFS